MSFWEVLRHQVRHSNLKGSDTTFKELSEGKVRHNNINMANKLTYLVKSNIYFLFYFSGDHLIRISSNGGIGHHEDEQQACVIFRLMCLTPSGIM